MKKKTKLLPSILLSALLLCSCGQQENESNTFDSTMYDDIYAQYFGGEKTGYTCATDLVGESIADIEDAGFDFDLIMDLTEYNINTAKPYTILVDGTYAFAAAVICKDNADIVSGIDTSMSMHDLEENFDIDTLYWSEAFQAHYTERTISLKSGGSYNLRYMWCPPDPNKILFVDADAKSDCAFVYKDSYVYSPDSDFMGFDFGTNIYDIQSWLIDRGYYIGDFIDTSNTIMIQSISEKLYGHDFFMYFRCNNNMKLTGGEYRIACSDNVELARLFETARDDLIAKYGDTYKIYLYTMFDSLDEQLNYIRGETEKLNYDSPTKLYWNVNGHTRIELTLDGGNVNIQYKSIASTGGTHMNEDSLI
ncbi:MAG: hypothetical protein J1F11_05565 [Oscillospiraceae bacterium]|nr:hypothetical protein [Oscillospiraceae bacterium]